MQVLHTLYIPPVLYYMCMHMYTTWQLVHLAHSLGLHVMHNGIKQKLQSPCACMEHDYLYQSTHMGVVNFYTDILAYL
jgi:hypothetical protein